MTQKFYFEIYLKPFKPIFCFGTSLILFFSLILSAKSAGALNFQQPSFKVEGKVISANDGTPLPGVSVTVVGNSTIGVATDANGNYQLNLPSNKSALRFTLLGFKAKDVLVNGKSVINVSLETDAATLDQVVIVGYGQQKKINQTGASQTVRFDGAVNQPVTNSAQLMYGKFSGVQLTQSSGLPGSDGSSVFIRGVGTFGSTTPLIVIDNIQFSGMAEFNNLAPSDIESISVLKGSSASAIYGARGANGVIVIVTKKGKSGAMTVSYDGYTGIQQVTVVPQYLNALNYAQLKNEHDINLNGPTAPIRYSDADIKAIMNGSEPDMYANTNWANVLLRTAPIQNHYLSFSGGNDKTTYRISLGYLNQEAVVKGKFKAERYNFGFNFNSKVNNWLTINNVTNGYWKRFAGPAGGPNAITGETGIINQFERSAPTVPAYYSNGKFGIVDGSYQNVNYSFPITNGLQTGILGDYRDNNINISERLGITIKLFKDVSFETSGSLNLVNDNTSNFSPTNTTYDYNGTLVAQNLTNTLSQGSSFNYNLLNENILRYDKTFHEKHKLSVLLGQSASYNRVSTFNGSLQGFPSDSYQQFDAGGVLNPQVSGNAVEEAIQSFFSRVNYAFEDKYLLELNVRRDGSSKFGPTHHYGNFPSASAGWVLSKEDFLKNISWLSELKLRGEWGVSGNDNIGNYIYEQSFNSHLNYVLGGATETTVGAVALTALNNPNITWETVKQYDFAVDAAFFNNRLSFTAEYFKKNSSGVLYDNYPIPSSIGVTNLAAENSASISNGGLEVSVNYAGKIGGLNYKVGGSVSKYARNNVTSLGNNGVPTINGATIVEVGAPFMAYYGYKVQGIFQTQAAVNAAPQQFGSTKTAPGDFQYVDISGPNGVPDGKIDAYDRTVIGNPYPGWVYNFNANLSYRGIDFSVVFDGLGGINRLMNSNGELPFPDDRNNALSYWVNRWTPSNPSTSLPRLGGQNNTIVSDFYVQDASYLRMKNVEIGYTLPALLTQKFGINHLRIYASGQNLLTFTKMKNFDPERAAGTASDQNVPLYKIYTLGLNIKF
ncbi:MAG: SusC/RagA family TonB-linked outer membrane protein [Mucilaginibacter sp.]